MEILGPPGESEETGGNQNDTSEESGLHPEASAFGEALTRESYEALNKGLEDLRDVLKAQVERGKK